MPVAWAQAQLAVQGVAYPDLGRVALDTALNLRASLYTGNLTAMCFGCHAWFLSTSVFPRLAIGAHLIGATGVLLPISIPITIEDGRVQDAVGITCAIIAILWSVVGTSLLLFTSGFLTDFIQSTTLFDWRLTPFTNYSMASRTMLSLGSSLLPRSLTTTCRVDAVDDIVQVPSAPPAPHVLVASLQRPPWSHDGNSEGNSKGKDKDKDQGYDQDHDRTASMSSASTHEVEEGLSPGSGGLARTGTMVRAGVVSPQAMRTGVTLPEGSGVSSMNMALAPMSRSTTFGRRIVF